MDPKYLKPSPRADIKFNTSIIDSIEDPVPEKYLRPSPNKLSYNKDISFRRSKSRSMQAAGAVGGAAVSGGFGMATAAINNAHAKRENKLDREQQMKLQKASFEQQVKIFGREEANRNYLQARSFELADVASRREYGYSRQNQEHFNNLAHKTLRDEGVSPALLYTKPNSANAQYLPTGSIARNTTISGKLGQNYSSVAQRSASMGLVDYLGAV